MRLMIEVGYVTIEEVGCRIETPYVQLPVERLMNNIKTHSNNRKRSRF